MTEFFFSDYCSMLASVKWSVWTPSSLPTHIFWSYHGPTVIKGLFSHLLRHNFLWYGTICLGWHHLSIKPRIKRILSFIFVCLKTCTWARVWTGGWCWYIRSHKWLELLACCEKIHMIAAQLAMIITYLHTCLQPFLELYNGSCYC